MKIFDLFPSLKFAVCRFDKVGWIREKVSLEIQECLFEFTARDKDLRGKLAIRFSPKLIAVGTRRFCCGGDIAGFFR